MLATKNEQSLLESVQVYWKYCSKYASLLDILLVFSSISCKLAHTEQYIQSSCIFSKTLRSFLVASIVQVIVISLYRCYYDIVYAGYLRKIFWFCHHDPVFGLRPKAFVYSGIMCVYVHIGLKLHCAELPRTVCTVSCRRASFATNLHWSNYTCGVLKSGISSN